jgi:hypothetical protein
MLAGRGPAVKAEREGIDRPLGDVDHQRAHQARVDAAREKAAERHVGHQHALHRAAQLDFQPRKRLVLAELELLRVVGQPVALDRELAALQQQPVAGLELANVAIDRGWRRDVLALEIQPERIEVELAADRGVRQQRLQLRAEHQRGAVPVVIQGFDAKVVARDEQALRAPVPQSKREHALQVLEHAHAVLPVGVKQRLGVAVGAERMAARLQLAPQRGEVVDLAVEHAREVAVGRAHRLRAAGEVDDRQAAETERERAVAVVAFVVRAAMLQRSRHALQHSLRRGATAQITREAAH